MNYFLPHGGHAAAFPRPCPYLAVGVATFVSPLSLSVEASLIQHDLLEGFGHCASIILGPHLWLAIEAAIATYPLSLLGVGFLIQCYVLEVSS